MKLTVSRKSQMLHKAVFVDGFPGCGKTMLSPIVASFDKVEIMQYAPLVEQMCELWEIGSISDDVAISMVRMNMDMLIYNVMMGRNTNCRYSDLSSIFSNKPLTHIVRMLRKGDQTIPGVIEQEHPVLHLTTHMLLPGFPILAEAMGDKMVFIEVVRHPLYMIIQQEKNFDMFEGSRNQHVRYVSGEQEYTFFTAGMEEVFDQSNSFEKAIYSMKWYFDKMAEVNHDAAIVIPFERFVKQPDDYMSVISKAIGSSVTGSVKKEMRRQRVPRKQLTDSPSLEIYKRCGWVPPAGVSEQEELNIRREWVANNVSESALALLDEISDWYVENYLDGYVG